MNFKRLLVSLIFLGFAAHATEPPLVFMEDTEPAMKRAFERAKFSLDEFLTISQSKAANLVGFAVKVGITEGRDTEYFWITDFTVHGEKFSGKIGNTPQMVRSVKFDQIFDFRREQVVDWLYVDRSRRKMVGNFTYCALLTKESSAKATAEKMRFNLDCD